MFFFSLFQNRQSMDVLVVWKDNSKNVVSTNDLVSLDKQKQFGVGAKIKMIYDKIWYYGTIIATENEELDDEAGLEHSHTNYTSSESENDEPLKKRQSREWNLSDDEPLINLKNASLQGSSTDLEHKKDIYNEGDNSGICQVTNCNKEVWCACHRCLFLICWDHFEDNNSCIEHNFNREYPQIENSNHEDRIENISSVVQIDRHPSLPDTEQNNLNTEPEDFIVEGTPREQERNSHTRINKQNEAKSLRNCGKQYISSATKKTVPARKLKDGCNRNTCNKFRKKCIQFSNADRLKLFEMFNNLGDLHSQREFIVRHISIMNTKQKTTQREHSRRQKTIQYYVTLEGSRLLVCKRFFLETFGITDKMVRNAILKTSDSGIIETEMRGGRQRSEEIKEKERMIRDAISIHIDRFPKMESHYCRKNTSRQYLHPDLTLRKMYLMFLENWTTKTKNESKPSFSTYQRAFKTKNLSFFPLKKISVRYAQLPKLEQNSKWSS